MEPDIKRIACPKNPDHGMTSKRLLQDDRQMISEAEGDVFEIDCPICGKYECQDELLSMTPRQSGGTG
jgi:hypothetical protein